MTWTVDQGTVTTAEQKRAAERARIETEYSAAIQAHMDAFARSHKYDSIHTGATYAGDPDPKFAAEGAAMRDWRSAVWVYSAAELNKVLTGQRPRPTVDEILAELPQINWP